MLENAGIPLPGETVLLFAGFLAWEGHLQLVPAILVGIAGATLGDNLGYWIGRAAGRNLLAGLFQRLPWLAHSFERSETAVLKYGPWAVFGGRFVAGLRVFAGILAGVFQMPYGLFFICNVSGATVWAIVMTSIGFAIGNRWPRIVHLLARMDQLTLLLFGIVILAVATGFWLREARKRRTQ